MNGPILQKKNQYIVLTNSYTLCSDTPKTKNISNVDISKWKKKKNHCIYTVKPALRGHLWDREKMAF